VGSRSSATSSASTRASSRSRPAMLPATVAPSSANPASTACRLAFISLACMTEPVVKVCGTANSSSFGTSGSAVGGSRMPARSSKASTRSNKASCSRMSSAWNARKLETSVTHASKTAFMSAALATRPATMPASVQGSAPAWSGSATVIGASVTLAALTVADSCSRKATRSRRKTCVRRASIN
ncbi:MAG: hypothetical protein EA416_00605, partial [Trueperaceae bacterium]